MCVIIHIPAGVELPSKNILKAAALHNRDGIGVVTSKGRTIKTMSFDKFYKFVIDSKIDEELLIHMRYATHGSVKKANCHPFYDEDTDIWFAHNGVLPIDSKNDMTDSEICFRERLVPAIKKYGYLSKEFLAVMNRERGGSKFAFMHNGVVNRFGSFERVDGVYYSNTYFMPLYRKPYEWQPLMPDLDCLQVQGSKVYQFLSEGESDIEI